MDRGRAPFPRKCDGGAAASGDLGKSSALHRRRRNRVKKQMCFFFSLFVLISPITFSMFIFFGSSILRLSGIQVARCAFACLRCLGWARVGCGEWAVVPLVGRCSPTSVYF